MAFIKPMPHDKLYHLLANLIVEYLNTESKFK